MNAKEINWIVATDSEGVFHHEHKIPWLNSKNPDIKELVRWDLKNFAKLTAGAGLIMGLNTAREISGFRKKSDCLFENRISIVVARCCEEKLKQKKNVLYAQDPYSAIELANTLDIERVFIFGGTRLLVATWALIDNIYHTEFSFTSLPKMVAKDDSQIFPLSHVNQAFPVKKLLGVAKSGNYSGVLMKYQRENNGR